MTHTISNLLYKLSKTMMIALLLAGVLGCAASPTPAKTLVTATVSACQPSPIQTSPTGFSEIQGTMQSEGELWALLFFGQARANEEVKIVWRVTGEGEFVVKGRHEEGTVISPVWGPEVHGESNWERPGMEWGTGFEFPKAGCWTLTGTLGTTSGEIRLAVAPP
jgi:hypothetical protein